MKVVVSVSFYSKVTGSVTFPKVVVWVSSFSAVTGPEIISEVVVSVSLCNQVTGAVIFSVVVSVSLYGPVTGSVTFSEVAVSVPFNSVAIRSVTRAVILAKSLPVIWRHRQIAFVNSKINE